MDLDRLYKTIYSALTLKSFLEFYIREKKEVSELSPLLDKYFSKTEEIIKNTLSKDPLNIKARLIMSIDNSYIRSLRRHLKEKVGQILVLSDNSTKDYDDTELLLVLSELSDYDYTFDDILIVYEYSKIKIFSNSNRS